MKLQQQDQRANQSDAPARRCAYSPIDGRRAYHATDYIQRDESLSTCRRLNRLSLRLLVAVEKIL